MRLLSLIFLLSTFIYAQSLIDVSLIVTTMKDSIEHMFGVSFEVLKLALIFIFVVVITIDVFHNQNSKSKNKSNSSTNTKTIAPPKPKPITYPFALPDGYEPFCTLDDNKISPNQEDFNMDSLYYHSIQSAQKAVVNISLDDDTDTYIARVHDAIGDYDGMVGIDHHGSYVLLDKLDEHHNPVLIRTEDIYYSTLKDDSYDLGYLAETPIALDLEDDINVEVYKFDDNYDNDYDLYTYSEPLEHYDDLYEYVEDKRYDNLI